MPAGWPGNSVTKAARAKAGGGFESAVSLSAPGAPSFTVSKTSTSITATITDSAGATSYESSVDGTNWFSGRTVTGLTAETPYTFQVRGINSAGTGPAASQAVTTNAATGDPSISSVTDNGDGTLSITGSNFGAKTQAAPVLFDNVDIAYENGVANTTYGDKADGSQILGSGFGGDATGIYDTTTSNVSMNKSDRPRVSGGASYRMPGAEGFLGYPNAYGGRQTPAGNDTLYLAWWVRRKWHWNYWRLAQGDMLGTFTPGEAITVNGIDGFYIDYSASDGLYHFQIPRYNTTDLSGQVITGVSSGATLTFSTAGYGGLPGTKFARFRDNPAGGGQGGSYTPADYYISPSTPRVYDRLGYSETPPDAWELHEVLIQYDFVAGTGTFDAWVNAKHRGKVDQPSINAPDLNYSLIFSLLGNDAYEAFQVTDVDFVYMDEVPQRVYIGNAATWSAVTHRELQRPTVWATDAVTVAKNLGTLASGWVYVVGPDGAVNETGVAI